LAPKVAVSDLKHLLTLIETKHLQICSAFAIFEFEVEK